MVPNRHCLVYSFIALVVLPLSRSTGLYNSTDKVKILTQANFGKEIFGKNHSTLVEFYNSYCGYCRKFAPHYKELAEELYGWRDVLPLAVIDCEDEENNDICRDCDIMGYPTLKYFGPGSHSCKDFILIKSQDKTIITNKLAEFISVENRTINMTSWPDFQPLQYDNPLTLSKYLSNLTKYAILVYEEENSTVGIQMILHFVRYPDIAVKRITDAELAAKYQMNDSENKIAIVNRSGQIEHYIRPQKLSSSYKEAIKYFLSSAQITEKPDLEEKKNTLTELIEEAGTTTNRLESNEESRKLSEIIAEVRRNKHMVYQADLELAIHHILHNEIPKTPDISNEKMLALQNFLIVLDRHNPLEYPQRDVISSLAAFASRQEKELSGKDFETELNKLEKQFGSLSSNSTRFIGCAGSKENFRGFTCSLWQLFHFMSVKAADSNKTQDPSEVLRAMHGYIKHFFGCTSCSQHFQAMASRRKIWSNPSKDKAVLWLWAAHNEVNQRLAGDNTEDPEFPKIQFPSVSSCLECYKHPESNSTVNPEDKWNEEHVLQFLKYIHNPEHISRYGLEKTDLLQSTAEKLRHKRFISNVFSDVDMRMGMLLYVCCIIMLVGAFKLFAAKRSYRKKPYTYLE